jgi:hypothetical protein
MGALSVVIGMSGSHWSRWQTIAFLVLMVVVWIYGIIKFFSSK